MIKKILKIFILLQLLSGTSIAGIDNYLSPHKFKGVLKKEIAELDIGFKLKANLDITEGLGAMLAYQYRVEPSFNENFYTRVDQYRLKTHLNIGDLIKDDLPVYLNLEKDSSIVFARFIRSQKKALKAKPILFNKLPLNAKKFDELPQGTLASIPAKLNIVAGAQAIATSKFVSARAGFYYSINGSFNIHILKMDKNKARLRVFSERSHARGTYVEASIDLDIFEIGIAKKVVRKLFGEDLVKLGMNHVNGKFLIFDYIFDMRNKDARRAYNKVLSSTLSFKNLKLLNPLTKSTEIASTVVSDFTAAEYLAKADHNDKYKRVEKVMSGFDRFTSKSRQFGYNLLVYKKGSMNGNDRHFFKYKSRNLKEKNLVMRSNTNEKKQRYLFGLRKENHKERYFILSEANSNGVPISNGFSNVGVTEEFRDKRLDMDEQEIIINNIMAKLPKVISDKIDFSEIRNQGAQRNFRSRLSITINKKLRTILRKMNGDSFKKNYEAHIDWLKDSKNISLEKSNDPRELDKIINKIKNISKPLTSSSMRENGMIDFIRLVQNKAFKEIGFGAMLNSLAKAGHNLNKYVNVKLSWSSDRKNYSFVYGTENQPQALKSLEFIMNVIQNGNTYDFHIVEYKP